MKGANDTLEQLAEARDKASWGSINGLEKSLAFHQVDFIEAMWAVVNWQDMAKGYAAAKERGDGLLLAP
ncbi:superoxide dismutase [Streptomyces bingchenggensis BCW-1]|uniref:Superoxide dismutase n=1 Tax=Streptomyces bingchenggensis (strain BCW-1) TaxID=749414 RepID=D7CA50_STRBB|nr:superoxide dismutase [Streptomyces bingchenggensis BCW-1]